MSRTVFELCCEFTNEPLKVQREWNELLLDSNRRHEKWNHEVALKLCDLEAENAALRAEVAKLRERT